MPQVSVIIPTHNRVALLRRAIASVLAQTVGDFEIVIADDASDDETRQMVTSIGDARIRYIRHSKTLGASAARNTAIANAIGEYIAFLDDDDEWLPDKLERQLQHMATIDKTVGVTCCGNYEVETSTNQVLAEIRPTLRGRLFERMMLDGRYYRTSTILVRAECFEKVGLFDTTFLYGEDFDMWLRLARHYDFDCLETPLVKVYLQPNGLTQNYEAIISGAEADLAKYREFYERRPRVLSKRLQRLGTYYCFVGKVRRGRKLFRHALTLDCLAMKAYGCFFLSFLGADAFRRGYATKSRLSETLTWSR
jgi:glycosyltransferase involved in cell wall biosynthesis